MKLSKKICIAIGVAAAIYLTHKSTIIIAAVSGLSKDLPEYLKNNFGEKPKLTMKIVFKRCWITLAFKPETLTQYPDLQEQVEDYIERFYPAISKLKLSVDIAERMDAIEEEDLEEEMEETEE